MLPVAAPRLALPAAVDDDRVRAAFVRLYEDQFAFVFRSARRLGVELAAVDDVVQETFVVAFRRHADFEERSSPKTWLFGILRRVVQDYRRTLRRKGADGRLGVRVDPESVSSRGAGPLERAAEAEAVRQLYELLGTLDSEKREVFVLAELEQMRAPEIAEALGANLNTVYSRLRAARRDFDKAVARLRVCDGWRSR